MFWRNTTRFVLPQILTFDPAGTAGYSRETGYALAAVDSTAEPFTDLVVSWNADTPAGTALRVEARVLFGPEDDQPEAGTWCEWQVLGHWGSGDHEGTRLPRCREMPAEPDPAVRVAIDTLLLEDGLAATAFAVRLTLLGGAETPVVRLLAASTSHRRASVPEPGADPPLGQAVHLAVPARSQRVERPEIAGEICSPTSVGMVLQYYGIDQPTEQIAQRVFDHGAGIYGNWPFNVAYAASHGLQAEVQHFRSMGAVERELQAGHPVIISVAYAKGELPESSLAATEGHLLVVTGVTAEGDFLVNDPAAHPGHGEAISRIYTRAHLRPIFLRHGGVGYVIRGEPALSRETTPATPAPRRV